MKKNQKQSNTALRKRIIAASIGGCVMLPLVTAQAGFFRDLFRASTRIGIHSITDPITSFLNQQRELLRIATTGQVSWRNLTNVLIVDYRNLQEMGFNLLNPFVGGCDLSTVSTPYGPIQTHCFDGEDRGHIQQGINRLSAYRGNMEFNGQSLAPVAHMVQYTTGFFDMDAPDLYRYLTPELIDWGFTDKDCGPISELWGCHVSLVVGNAGITGLTPGIMLETPIVMAGLLLHESHHSPYGPHEKPNGEDFDSNCGAPYPLEASFLVDAYRGAIPNLDSSERNAALSVAMGRVATRMAAACGNAVIARLQAPFSQGATPPPVVAVCMVDESGQQVCSVRQADAYFSPPPPPPSAAAVCFIDESGQQVCY